MRAVRLLLRAIDVLVYQDWISIRIVHHETGGAYAIWFGFGNELSAQRIKSFLNIAHVFECVDGPRVLIPIGIECQWLLFDHPREETDDSVAGFHDPPALTGFAVKGNKPKCGIACFLRGDVFDAQTDGKGNKLHIVPR